MRAGRVENSTGALPALPCMKNSYAVTPSPVPLDPSTPRPPRSSARECLSVVQCYDRANAVRPAKGSDAAVNSTQPRYANLSGMKRKKKKKKGSQRSTERRPPSDVDVGTCESLYN